MCFSIIYLVRDATFKHALTKVTVKGNLIYIPSMILVNNSSDDLNTHGNGNTSTRY